MPVEELYRWLHAARPDLTLTPCPADGAESSVKSAYKKAKAQAGPEDLIYIGGSNFVVAEALKDR
jgi:folylpolyglutamate synthase/dihydropteroate synthase